MRVGHLFQASDPRFVRDVLDHCDDEIENRGDRGTEKASNAWQKHSSSCVNCVRGLVW